MKRVNLLMLGILFLTVANAKNIFVDPTNGLNVEGGGATWETAVKTLSAAISNSITGFVAGDNIYVKGGTIDYSVAFATGNYNFSSTANYYGSCDLTNNGTSTVRTTYDADGNGIVESWEFQDPTTISSIVTCSTGNVTAFVINNAGYTFNGFTLTHVATNTTAYYLRSIVVNGNVNFINCSMINSNTVPLTSTGTNAFPAALFFYGAGANVNNCLFEKNTVSFTNSDAQTNSYAAFIAISATTTSRGIAANSIVRNNSITASFTKTPTSITSKNGGMLLTTNTAAGYSTIIKNCLIYNNEMVYTGTGAAPATVGIGASLQAGFSASGNNSDSIINCTIANNRATGFSCAGMMVFTGNSPTHKILNNALWNNKLNDGTISNVDLTNFPANSLFMKNVTNAGNNSIADNGTTITSNDYTLSDVNNTGNRPLFVSPTATVGYNFSDNTISTSVWKLNSSSYLIGKGIALNNNVTDKAGISFLSTPSVGAYEWVSPTTVFNQLNNEVVSIKSIKNAIVTQYEGDLEVVSLAGSIIRNSKVTSGEVVYLPAGIYIARTKVAGVVNSIKVLIL